MAYLLRENGFATEGIMVDRLRELATHHGWDNDQMLMRLANALINGGSSGDPEWLLWEIDYVASGEAGARMFDATPLSDRQDRPLEQAWRAARYERNADGTWRKPEA
jgi:hypothetical protein